MRSERSREPRICVGVDFRSTLLCPEHGISESLCCLVGELPSAKRLEPNLPFIERALCCLACAVELFLQLVE